VADRWWLVAGRRKTGTGSLEPDERKGEPLELRTEEERFTSLFGGSGGGVLSGSIGVVDPACEKAIEPFECETAAEPGRDMGVEVDSRELDMLLDKRRIHDRGRVFGVAVRDGGPSSGSAARSAPILKLVLGVNILFCPTLALLDRAFPFGPSLNERAVGGVEKAKGGWTRLG
jgi:hypothetical protein